MVDFVCIGPGRSGSTWLYEIFNKCPEIYLAKNIKEVEFFNNNFDKGLTFYHNFFKGAKASQIKGEISNLYFQDKKTLERINNYNPNVKIIMLVRNPEEKIKSLYLFKRREGAFNNTIEVFTRSNLFRSNIKEVKFDIILNDLLSIFSKEQIFIVPFEMISGDQCKLLDLIGEFLNIKKLNKYRIDEKINQSIVPRVKYFGVLSKLTAILLRKMRLYSVLTFLKRSDFLKSILFKKTSISSIELNLDNNLKQELLLSKDSYKKILSENFKNTLSNTNWL